MTDKLKPRSLILAGYGINCDNETNFACELAGFKSDIVHVNELIQNKSLLSNYELLVFPGGFSYGDDTGSGNGLANKLKNNLETELNDFTNRETTLTMGICNGFQVLINLGLLPFNDGKKHAALTFNTSARYHCSWVRLYPSRNPTPFLKSEWAFELPVAHGEGRFYAEEKTINKLKENNQIVIRYEHAKNWNGSIDDIAGICSEDGRIFGLMPHPERAMFHTQLPNWTLTKELRKRYGNDKNLPMYAQGLKIFKNAYLFFQGA